MIIQEKYYTILWDKFGTLILLQLKKYKENNMKLIKEDKLFEAGLSRLWQHTKDEKTFAIIGSQDQDTREDRYNDLIDEIRVLSRKKAGIGFNNIDGVYTYEDSKKGTEYSLIIYNLSKEDALKIGNKLNQESIIWKDENFFGMLTCKDGSVDFEFNNYEKNMNLSKEAIQKFSSKIKGKGHAKNAPFVFESYFNLYNRKTHLDEKLLLFKYEDK